MAVLSQPGKDGTMQMQEIGLPPALEYLKQVNRLNVRQKKEMFEIVTGFETYNRYEVTNTQGQQVFFVQEESSCLEIFCFPFNRGFVLHITDNNSQEVMRVTREFKCCTGCCWCADGFCNMEIIVEAPVGRVVGRARTSWWTEQARTNQRTDLLYRCIQRVRVFSSRTDTFTRGCRTGTSKCQPHFKIHDAADTHLFTIWGPCCPCQAPCCPEDLRFPIQNPSLTHEIGVVGKQWRGCCTEHCTDVDTLYVEFPQDMLVDTKALLFGTIFLVDYLLFERQNKNN